MSWHTHDVNTPAAPERPPGGLADVPCLALGLRERKKARTREAIIDAALDLFERNGFEATTIEDIAAAADVSPRTFFRYFDSKVDLVMARNSAKEKDLTPLILARPAEEAPLEAMRQVICDVLCARLEDTSVVREFHVVMTTPSLRALAREHFYEHVDDVAHAFALRMGADENDLRAHVLAGAVTAAIWTVVDRWVADGAVSNRLLPMLDDAFALLSSGLDGSVAAK
jgi:AcrR family transcriptional regulator